jgi:carboxymethylenebutenolidase
MAAAGFTALVPDLYRGKSTVEAEEAHHLMSGLNFGDAASQDVRGAVRLPERRARQRQGRRHRLLHGRRAHHPVADHGAGGRRRACVWYGLPPLEYVDAGKIGSRPVMAHWATQDQAFTIAKVDALEAKLHEPRAWPTPATATWRTTALPMKRPRAPAASPMTQYDAAWAQLAWDRTMRFFGHTLG